MIWNVSRLSFAALAISLFVATPGFADLFALISQTDQILRINSASGAVTQTIQIPEYVPPTGGVTAGLAFDGQVLYLTRSLGTSSFLVRYDVVNDIWDPRPVFLPTMPDPAFPPQPVSGLGIMPDGFGGGNLVAVTTNPAGDPPSYMYQFQTFGSWSDMVVPTADRVALAADLNAQGADIDSSNGELWISANQLNAPLPNTRLLHTDYAGNVLATLTPNLNGPIVIRGLGFDNGSMFIAGRNAQQATNNVYEINRSTGEVIRSFTLPVTPPISALTGGAIVPEPGCLMLLSIGIAGFAMRRRR